MQPVDPQKRRRTLRWLGPTAGLGLMLAAVLTVFGQRVEEAQDRPLLYALFAALVVVGILVLSPVWRLWQTGRQAKHQRRFPPPDSAVVRDTRVYRGEAAVVRGGLLQALAVSLGVFVVLTPLAIGWLILGPGPFRP